MANLQKVSGKNLRICTIFPKNSPANTRQGRRYFGVFFFATFATTCDNEVVCMCVVE